MQQRRCLIIIPIVHTRADFGSLGSKVPFDQEVEEMTTRFWNGVFNYVYNLAVDFSKLKVYQDGLPDTSAEFVERIIDETQTPNYDVLRWLKDKGAHIIGTENPPFLLQEFRALQTIFNAKDEEQKQAARLEHAKVNASLLEKRDKYIAQRIINTLPGGGTGLLFLGLLHEVKRLLEQEIKVSEPEALIGGSSETLREKLKLYGKEREV